LTRDTGRAVRLIQIQGLISRSPLGLTVSELAERHGVSTRTMQRDILTLQTDLHIPIQKRGYDRYGLPGGYHLPPVFLSLQEAVGLFLAARLIIRQTDEHNPHIESALRKLAAVLPSPVGERLEDSLGSLARKPSNPDSLIVYEKVALAWSTRRRLRFRYRSPRGTRTKEWVIEPYFIEMTGTGYSQYVIGRVVSGEREGIITFKLDRIREAQLLEETFEIPEDMSLHDLLGSSWGIIWGDDVEVKLRFSPGVTRRVKESVWHPSQAIEDLPDGGCLLTVTAGSTLEMSPWIRGWGPDVEVLAPEALRKEFTVWSRQLYQMYNG
ncbi:MAG: WYL domain-containing protein, partial [Dehalococcoidia bacterium]|nr:WYL domain-containing protein [Dehalococcoidia bacterium]